MVALRTPHFTPEQYLTREREAAFRSEYLIGELWRREESSVAHCAITSNVAGELSCQLRGRPGRCYSAQLRVKAGDSGLIAYPDVAIVGDAPCFWGGERDVLINPGVIVEVLSPTTEAFDRGEKFARYKQIESFTNYVLIAQDAVRVEHHERQANGEWRQTTASDLADTVVLASIGCELRLSDIYDKVDLPAAPESQTTNDDAA